MGEISNTNDLKRNTIERFDFQNRDPIAPDSTLPGEFNVGKREPEFEHRCES